MIWVAGPKAAGLWVNFSCNATFSYVILAFMNKAKFKLEFLKVEPTEENCLYKCALYRACNWVFFFWASYLNYRQHAWGVWAAGKGKGRSCYWDKASTEEKVIQNLLPLLFANILLLVWLNQCLLNELILLLLAVYHSCASASGYPLWAFIRSVTRFHAK